MKTKIIPGAWYLDSRIDGAWCANIWHTQTIETSQGPVAKPQGDDVLWVVLSRTGFKMAGQSQNFLQGWEWQGEFMGWEPRTAPCGVWPVIYNDANNLITSYCQPGVGSQGYRYVAPNGTLVTGDATVLVRNGLNEWTDLSLQQDGTLLVGQDHEGRGLGVWAKGQSRILSEGACFNIRARREGDPCVVSCYNVAPDGIEGRIFWLTVAELEATGDIPPATTNPFPKEPKTQKPEVTVDTFNFGPQHNLRDGDYLKFHDRVNANGAQISVWVEGGSMYMSLRYPESGTGQTGLPRRVR